VIIKKAIENDECIKKISDLLNRLEISYTHISHFIQAFIHRSIVNERPEFAPEHNERLEFLGDAVLELVITDNLYSHFLDKSEGELTDIRSALVRGKNLARISKDL
jgi:ribonuclease III